MSETARYRHMTAQYCQGAGVDIASQGDAVVPWAMSFDLPEPEFSQYSSGQPAKGPIHLRGRAGKLPFDSASLDFVYASHILEDSLDWIPWVKEWSRCVRIGGHIIILIPEKDLWDRAIQRGQNPNCAHMHEGRVGELTELFNKYFGHFDVICDKLTALTPEDYTIMFVAKRIR